jgi:hypothetical protein
MYPDWLRDHYENYRFLLKKYGAYSDEKVSWPRCYSFDKIKEYQALQTLKERYHLDKLIKNRDALEICLKAMQWTFYQLLYREQGEFTGKLNALEILDFSRSNRVGVNCICHATVLTEVLLALGFKARNISCLPIDLIPIDNHVITTVYIAGMGKWIMLDPALCCYITDKKGELLSIPEIRRHLINETPLEVCTYSRLQNVQIPGSSFSSFDKTEYLAYLRKNFFRFMSCDIQDPACFSSVFFLLVPDGFLPSNVEQKMTQKDGVVIIRITNNAHFFWHNETKGEVV